MTDIQDRLEKCYVQETLENKKHDDQNSEGYTTETDTLTEVSAHQAKSQSDSQDSTVSYNSWAFTIRDSHHVKKFSEDENQLPQLESQDCAIQTVSKKKAVRFDLSQPLPKNSLQN